MEEKESVVEEVTDNIPPQDINIHVQESTSTEEVIS